MDADDRSAQRSRSAPAASELARTIDELIERAGMQPGDRIGAERELADRYQVSRWVVRKALDKLEEDARILRTNGRSGGVFVAPRKVIRDMDQLVGLPQYLQAQGMEAGTSVLGTRISPVGDELAKTLQVAADTWVIQIERLRLAEGLPFSVETVWFPAERFPGLLDESLVGSLDELIKQQYRIERGEAVETVTAVPADRQQAAMLQVPTGTPLLRVERVGSLTSGEVFEFCQEYFRGDRVSLTVHTHGAQNTAQRTLT